MGLGLEICFIFDVEEPLSLYLELKDRYFFEPRNGLNLIMTGNGDAGDENRLLRQVEKVLNVDLKWLDFWDYTEDYEGFISVQHLYAKLIDLENALVKNPEFFQKVSWGHGIEKGYLKDNFLKDIRFLIERLHLNMGNGASFVKYVSE